MSTIYKTAFVAAATYVSEIYEDIYRLTIYQYAPNLAKWDAEILTEFDDSVYRYGMCVFVENLGWICTELAYIEYMNLRE